MYRKGQAMDPISDEVLRVHSRLAALRSNYVDVDWISIEVGKEYDSLLDRAAASLNIKLDEFKVGGSNLSPNSKYHEGHAFRSQIDGALNYLIALMPPEAKGRIGYQST